MLRMIFCLFFLFGGALATPRDDSDEGSRHVVPKKAILSLEERIAEAGRRAEDLKIGCLEEAIKLTPFDRDVQDAVLASSPEPGSSVARYRDDLIFTYTDLISWFYKPTYWEDVSSLEFHQAAHVIPWEVSLCQKAQRLSIFTGEGYVTTRKRERGLTQLENLPDDLPRTFESVYMVSTGLKQLPLAARKWSQMTMITVSGNELTSIDEFLPHWTALSYLNIADNPIKSQPKGLLAHESLNALIVSAQQIRDWGWGELLEIYPPGEYMELRGEVLDAIRENRIHKFVLQQRQQEFDDMGCGCFYALYSMGRADYWTLFKGCVNPRTWWNAATSPMVIYSDKGDMGAFSLAMANRFR